MIVITGATGQLGSQVLDRLLERVPADAVGVSVRDVNQVRRPGVRVRRGDFTEPETLRHAFEGADRVLVISASIRGAGAAEANIAAIDAAYAAGAERVFYTSHQAASMDSLFAPQITHARAERHLAERGLPHTVLRNGFYASTLAYYTGDAIETGRLVAPADGPVSWTAHADLAEAAAIALTGDRDVTAPLTASRTLDFADVAGILGDLAGRTIERVVVGDDEWKATVVAGGMPPAAADFTLGMFRAARRGEFAVTDPALEDLIGHAPTPVQAVLLSSHGRLVRTYP